jgi:ABC-type lipoprotein release transport system permease subunit
VAADVALVPWQLGAFVVGALLVGVAVAAVPAWRATRHPVADGLRAE